MLSADDFAILTYILHDVGWLGKMPALGIPAMTGSLVLATWSAAGGWRHGGFLAGKSMSTLLWLLGGIIWTTSEYFWDDDHPAGFLASWPEITTEKHPYFKVCMAIAVTTQIIACVVLFSSHILRWRRCFSPDRKVAPFGSSGNLNQPFLDVSPTNAGVATALDDEKFPDLVDEVICRGLPFSVYSELFTLPWMLMDTLWGTCNCLVLWHFDFPPSAIGISICFGVVAVLMLLDVTRRYFQSNEWADALCSLAEFFWVLGNIVWMSEDLITDDTDKAARLIAFRFICTGACVGLASVAVLVQPWVCQAASDKAADDQMQCGVEDAHALIDLEAQPMPEPSKEIVEEEIKLPRKVTLIVEEGMKQPKKSSGRKLRSSGHRRAQELPPMYIDLPPTSATLASSTASSETAGDSALDSLKTAALVAVSKLQSPSIPLLLVNLSHIQAQLRIWKELLPRVQPYQILGQGVDRAVTSLLLSSGCQLACATTRAIETALGLGAEPRSLLVAQPRSSREQLRQMYSQGLRLMSFHDAGDLRRLAAECPEAKLMLSVAVAAPSLSIRFGASSDEWQPLLELARELGLEVVGASFRVGSGQSVVLEAQLGTARELWSLADSMGMKFSMLDLGSTSLISNRDGHAVPAPALKSLASSFPEAEFPHLQIMADAGQVLFAGASTLLAHVDSRLAEMAHSELGKPPVTEYKLNGGSSDSLQKMFAFCCTHISPEAMPKVEGTLPSCLFSDQRDGVCQVEMEVPLAAGQDGAWLFWKGLDKYDAFTREHGTCGSLQVCYVTDRVAEEVVADL